MKKVKIREEAIQTRANMIEEGISFRDKLLMLNGKQRDMNMEESEDVEILEGDVRRRKENGVLIVEFSDRIHCLLAKSLKKSIIVKLLGRGISYKILCFKVENMWNPNGGYRVVDCHCISFSSPSASTIFLHSIFTTTKSSSIMNPSN